MCPCCEGPLPWAYEFGPRRRYLREYGPPPWAWSWGGPEGPYAVPGWPSKEERKAALESMKRSLEARLADISEELKGL